MKNKNLIAILLKSVAAACLVLIAALGLLLSSFTSQKLNDDVWKMLGISKQAGAEKIKNSFMSSHLDYYGLKNLKNIGLNNRGLIAKDLLNYTKEFVSGPVFKKQYDEMREQAKPEEPELEPLRSIAEIQKEEIAKTEKSIRETEKTIKDYPQMAKSMEPVIEMLKKNLKDYQDPKHQYFAALSQGEKYNQESRTRSYKERMDDWKEWYPEAADDFIAARLKKMLELTADIDYNAELVEKYGKKKFVNPAYERKSYEWKQGFRAGKDVTETARAFAQKWLAELQK